MIFLGALLSGLSPATVHIIVYIIGIICVQIHAVIFVQRPV